MQWRGSGFVVLGWWYVVAVVAAAGLFMMAFGDLRLGGWLMAGAFVFGAVVRIVAHPDRKAGGLHVRSRSIDVAILLLVAAALIVATQTVRLDTDGAKRAGVHQVR